MPDRRAPSAASSGEVPPPASRGGFPEVAQKNVRRNYGLHLAEGGLFMGGVSFVAVDTVLPNMVNAFGGPAWLISLTPLLMAAGVMGPQLFASHWIERLDAVHRYTVCTGFFQRLPFLLTALALFLFGREAPLLAVGFAVAAPLVSGLAAGLGGPAWKELISRTVPPERRASLHALRNTLGAIISLLAGWVIHKTLKWFPGADGYAILHGITFCFLMVSWLLFARLREVPQPDRTNRDGITLRRKLRQLPALLRQDAQLRFLSLASFSGPTIFIVIPFAAVYATEVTGKGQSFVGMLVIAKTVGLFLGNLVGGYFGDRRGGRLPLLLSRVLRLLFCLGIPFAATEASLLGLFFLYGMSFTLNMVGNQVLSLEVSPDGRRPTYLGILSMATFTGILLAPTLSSGIRFLSGEIWPLALASAIGTVVSGAAIFRMTEPRVHYPSGPSG